MDKYIGPLVLLFTLAGAVCVVLLTVWLLTRVRLTTFRKIALAFICAGAIVPIAILPAWVWINRHGGFSAIGGIQDVTIALWPTSIVLMALDSPGPLPWSTIAFVYGFSMLGNVGTYGIVGLIVGWLYVRLAGNPSA